MIHERTIGDAILTAMEIQTEPVEVDLLDGAIPGAGRDEIDLALKEHFGGSFPWSFTPVVISTKNETILFDTGNGFTGGPGRPMADLLAAARIPVGRITRVVISHAHGDHIGGLMENGRPTFPDAGEAPTDAAPGEAEIIPGEVIAEEGDVTVRGLPLYGHTPGHMGLQVSSGSDRVWLLADASHFLIQLVHPEWSPSFDVNPGDGAAARRRIFQAAADQSVMLQVFHYPFPGIGRIVREGGSFRWRPEE